MNMLPIPLKGTDEYALIDEEDEDRVKAHTWRRKESHGKPYAVARIDGEDVRLHRFVMGCAPGDAMAVTPCDGDFLNCWKANLSVATDPGRTKIARKKVARKGGCHHIIEETKPGRGTCVRCGATSRILWDE